MPSTSLQSRISAFESLAGGPSLHPTPNGHTSPSSFPMNPKENLSNGRDLLTETHTLPNMFTASSKNQVSPSPSPPNLGRKTSLIDLKDWIVDDGPLTPPRRNGSKVAAAVNGMMDFAKTPTQPAFNAKSSSNNHSTPLINFDSPPRPTPKPKPTNLQSTSTIKAPPLPPRRSSYTSLKSVASTSSSHSTPPSSTFLYPPRRTDTLTIDQVHSYPPLPPNLTIDSRSRHATGSSISSFHSVSLSSDTDPSTPGSVTNFIATYPMDEHNDSLSSSKGKDVDSLSLTESYEDISTSSLASPTTERMISLDFEKARLKRKSIPPKLPQRPPPSSSSRSSLKSPTPTPRPRPSSASNSQSNPGSPIINPVTPVPTAYTVRRNAPVPNSRSSDRSSIRSTATSFSISSSNQSHRSWGALGNSPINIKTKRPTPVPPAAQRRYQAVFNGNIIQRRRVEKQRENNPTLLSPNEARGRRAAGWRGLSVDLITGNSVADQLEKTKPVVSEVDEVVSKNEKLEGAIIKLIWSRSGLDRRRLAEIWNECDPAHNGSLSIEAFIKGMWRIDEQLRRAEAQTLKSASCSSLASLASRQLHSGYKGTTVRSRNILH